ncbi:hypothetical protein DACRYDRAFT_119881 [Dacryopinax primogenitus]|uniref:Uncharacterized protein n=1 Tax=Dacryopinax primogenitus (strain DJM 731) TaxID=1858805 RepID=M5FN51_DACPD|nr:uncharacterized protein DACRYDRAFT_119881 [Dacryopinax primogenitus]EJT96835.1 hypothetical protein DACRYDRAFT_119881 [Dacryopinax primogenitus]
MPAGNSGALLSFLPVNASTSNTTGPSLDVQLVHSSLPLASTVEIWDNLGVAVIGAVRATRDYVEGGGLMHEIFIYTLQSYNSTHFRLHQPWINGTEALIVELQTASNVWFNVTPGSNALSRPPTIEIRLNDSTLPGIAAWKVPCNETSLTGLDTDGLFLFNTTSNNTALRDALVGLHNGSDQNAQEVSFLTYSNKFTAGGWRFLTYFGRDSLIALRLMMPLLQSDAIEAALGAVLERANMTGALCHEETIGDYASFVNMGNNMSDLGNTPYCDYKWVQHDFAIIDSNEGIGYGHYPFDVNSALVSASLRAIEALSLNGLIPANYTSKAGQYAAVWENYSASFFEVNVTAANASSRLQTFVSQANLSSSLLTGSGSIRDFTGKNRGLNLWTPAMFRLILSEAPQFTQIILRRSMLYPCSTMEDPWR